MSDLVFGLRLDQMASDNVVRRVLSDMPRKQQKFTNNERKVEFNTTKDWTK